MNEYLHGGHEVSRNEKCCRPAVSQTTDERAARMVRAFAGLCFFIFAGGAFSQNTGHQTALATPELQAADIHASSNLLYPRMQGGVVRSGRYELRQATMMDLIATAYGVDPDTVFGGPAWLELDRFDVIAKVPSDSSPDAAKAMLQELLAERFQLVVHRDTKAVQAFALALDKGRPKLKPADASGAAGCQTSKETSPGVAPYSVAACRNITMDGFAAALRGIASADITSPVANLTGLRGNWDLDLKWTDMRSLTSAASDITLVHAINEQLGLVLGRKPVRMPVLVVDHANQRPTPNPLGTTTLLPPPEFEVASIKPSAPGARPGGGRFLPGGRVEFRAMPLSQFILNAWDLNLLPDEIPGAPRWLAPFEPSFDLFAKAPASAIANGAQLYQGDYQMMLRALLVDRFKIVSHYEDRPMYTYILSGQKPKLRKADPAHRPGCKTVRLPNPAPSESAPVLLEAVCTNITMTQFAQQLQSLAPLYFHYPVSDATAIVGAWDFTFTFSRIPPDLLGGGGGGPRTPNPVNMAVPEGGLTDPVGAISILDAIKRLGLRLDIQKRPQAVFVIDHIERTPTEN
jgi:uncharacterized protein (TIGR03435 family)